MFKVLRPQKKVSLLQFRANKASNNSERIYTCILGEATKKGYNRRKKSKTMIFSSEFVVVLSFNESRQQWEVKNVKYPPRVESILR
jgi:hypothetical protein